MRITVTLDADVEAGLRRLMRQKGLSFKEALNDTIRRGLRLGQRARDGRLLPSFDMGVRPEVSLDKALRLAGALENEAYVRRLEVGR